LRIRRYAIGELAVIVLLLGIVLMASLLYPHFRRIDYVNGQVTLQNPLRIPPLLQPRLENGETVFDLKVMAGQNELLPGKLADTAGFNGSFLGPTLRVHKGAKIRINVTNDLSEVTTVHWHGMHLPAAMDGGPHPPPDG
jgi:FtsP/CotA-like multicopper oxidase with cupredoxin domain